MGPVIYFRAGVGVLVRNVEGLILVLERSDIAGSWQLPQGGIEAGESALEAAQRELYEEAGITTGSIRWISEHPRWLSYELPAATRTPKTGLGQTQRWFLADYVGNEPFVLGEEFAQWQWMPMVDLLTSTWWPRQPVYLELLHWWSDLLLDHPN